MKNKQNQRGFTLMELLVVMAILAILIVSFIANFSSSQKRSRDIKRKNDLRQISLALESYYNDFGHYPYANANGAMMGCGAGAILACDWGGEWKNTSTSPQTVYMLTIPGDSLSSYAYYYRSDASGTYFQLYARLENSQDEGTGVNMDGYSGTDCGNNVTCTYGIASNNTTP